MRLAQRISDLSQEQAQEASERASGTPSPDNEDGQMQEKLARLEETATLKLHCVQQAAELEEEKQRCLEQREELKEEREARGELTRRLEQAEEAARRMREEMELERLQVCFEEAQLKNINSSKGGFHTAAGQQSRKRSESTQPKQMSEQTNHSQQKPLLQKKTRGCFSYGGTRHYARDCPLRG